MRIKTFSPLPIAGVVTGFGGLLAGLFLLDGEPIFGALGVLGAMALLLAAVAKLANAKIRSDFAKQETNLGEY